MRIADYLDHPLRSAIRVRTLESLAGEVTAQPVAAVVCDLRQVLQDRRLHGDDKLRLDILLSQLYHRGGITGPHVEQLRTEIATAWEARTHAYRKGGRSAEPRSAPGPGPR